MAIHDFDDKEQYVTIDAIPDFRSEAEKQNTPLAIYNHNKSDIAYAERLSEEIINISGAWVTLFLKEPKRDAKEIEVWDEDADPIYRNGMKMKSYFKPEPNMQELTRWGLDLPYRITAVFSRATIMKTPTIGARLLLPGDVIEAPYNLPTTRDTGPLRFRILNVKQDGNFMYRWLYLNCTCELLTGDKAVSVKAAPAPKVSP